MDDRFDKENIEAETRYPRREAVDGHTRYPVREERRPLRFSSEHHTELPGRKIDAENDMTAYEQRTAARRAEFLQNSYENSYEREDTYQRTSHQRGQTRGQQRGQTEVPRSRERVPHEEQRARRTREAERATHSRKKHHKKRHLTRFFQGAASHCGCADYRDWFLHFHEPHDEPSYRGNEPDGENRLRYHSRRSRHR